MFEGIVALFDFEQCVKKVCMHNFYIFKRVTVFHTDDEYGGGMFLHQNDLKFSLIFICDVILQNKIQGLFLSWY